MWLGRTPTRLILTLLYQSKYHCYIATLKSLALVSGNAQRVRVLLGPAGRIAISSVLFCLFSIGGPANLCDSVATECLPAAECGAAAALIPPFPPPHHSLPPCGSLQTGFPPLPPSILLLWASRPRAALSELAHLY